MRASNKFPGPCIPYGLSCFAAGRKPIMKANGIEAIVEVRIAKDDEPDTPTPTGKRMIRWSGDVPPQKWMNFYTKVLSRFACSSELKLTVSFEAPMEDDHGEAKADEA